MRATVKGALMAAALAGAMLHAQAAAAAEVVWWITDPAKQKGEALAAAFEKLNPDIKIKIQTNPYAGLENKVPIALRSGNPPDLIEVQTSWIPSYAATGKLRDIAGVLTSAKVDLKDFIPAALASASVGERIYGLPFQAEALATVYNKTQFKEAGLDPNKPPRTWPELLDAARKLTRVGADGVQRYGYGIAGGGPGGQSNVIYRSLPYIWMNGGDIVSEDLKSSPIDSPQAVEAVAFYTDMFTKHKVSPPSTLENGGLELRRLFMAGTIAMYQGTPTELDVFRERKLDFEFGVSIIPHPEGKTSSALLGGWAFIAPAEAKNRQATDKFVAFLATPENVGTYTRTFPTMRSAMSMARFSDPNLDAFKEMLTYARAQPRVESWVRITDIYYKNLQEILIGGATPKDGMAKTAADINKVLK